MTFLGSVAVVIQRNETGCAKLGASGTTINPSRMCGRKGRITQKFPDPIVLKKFNLSKQVPARLSRLSGDSSR